MDTGIFLRVLSKKKGIGGKPPIPFISATAILNIPHTLHR
jgi:hypothetical protein